MLYVFGDYVLDTKRQELRQSGTSLPLQFKVPRSEDLTHGFVAGEGDVMDFLNSFSCCDSLHIVPQNPFLSNDINKAVLKTVRLPWTSENSPDFDLHQGLIRL